MNKNQVLQVLKELEKINSDFQVELKEIRERFSRLRELVYNIPDLERKYKANDFTPEEGKIIDEYEDLIFGEIYALEHRKKKIQELQGKTNYDAMKAMLEKTMNDAKPSLTPLSFMFDGKATQALGRAKTNSSFDTFSRTFKITNGVNIFMPENTFKIGVGTAKIFRYAVAEFTKHNNQNATKDKIKYSIFLDVTDFAQHNGVDINSESAMKNFRFKLRKNLETLRYSGVSWEEKIKGKTKSFGGMNYIGKYDLKGNTLEIEFTVTMAEYLTSLPLLTYPTSLYRIDDREFNAFAIGEALCLHYSQENNVIKGTENKLRIETLLNYTSFPTWEKIKQNKWSWEEKVKEPFERTLDVLIQCGFLKDYSYCYEGGIEITDEEMRTGNPINSYQKFISLILKYELNDFAPHQERLAEITQKKAEQIAISKKRRKKKQQKADNNSHDE